MNLGAISTANRSYKPDEGETRSDTLSTLRAGLARVAGDEAAGTVAATVPEEKGALADDGRNSLSLDAGRRDAAEQRRRSAAIDDLEAISLASCGGGDGGGRAAGAARVTSASGGARVGEGPTGRGV
nr:unnamed protein product [Digitaria exilis]